MKELERLFADHCVWLAHQEARERRLLMPVQLYLDGLEAEAKRSGAKSFGEAARTIRKQVLEHTRAERVPAASFNVGEAAGQFAAFAQARHLQGELSCAVLRWLIESEFDDRQGSARVCKNVCQEAGVVAALAMDLKGDAPSPPELGFGELLAASQLVNLLGREKDLERHAQFVRIALRQGTHYLLRGHPGVGKTLFARGLVSRLLLERSQGRRFLILQASEFIGPNNFIAERIAKCFEFLAKTPDLIPVFDGMEFFLDPQLPAYQPFMETFGAALSSSGRTFMLVARSAIAMKDPALSRLRSHVLDALPQEVSRQVAFERLERVRAERLGTEGPEFEGSTEAFARFLVQKAVEHYPDRYSPEIILHLCESVVERASDRMAMSNGTKKILKRDLWEHVASECSIDLEMMGAEPAEFYRKLKRNLLGELKGQDHAVDVVCDQLESAQSTPHLETPRGRFLFVGPPGVGKTQLAKSLAKWLGYDREAFFVLNMSEFSGDSARTRFTGADPGYVGFKGTRTIYDVVRDRPACVILLDEVDRAHLSIQDVLLSILEGKGNDATGLEVRFSQVIFIMTTNQGQDAVERAYEDHQGRREELARHCFDEEQGGVAAHEEGGVNLRSLLLAGAVDRSELKMQQSIEQQLATLRETPEEISAVVQYSDLKQLKTQFEKTAQRSVLDRAFLDRVDFIVPFFPIKEPELIRQIVDLKRRQFGIRDEDLETDGALRDRLKDIVQQTSGKAGSVRTIERLLRVLLVEITKARSPQTSKQ